MPAKAEVMKIVTILNEEGFGVIAGEMLTEMNLGREVLPPDQLAKDGRPTTENDSVDLGNGSVVSRVYFDEFGGRGQPEVSREPIPDREQLEFVARFLNLRLVEPVRAWAEAEEIAGDILSSAKDGGVKSDRSSDSVRIAFVPSFEGAAPRMARDAAPGNVVGTDELAKVLNRISEIDA